MAKNNELEKFSGLLLAGVTNLFQERGEIKFSKTPVSVRKRIIEYDGKMRVDGMEKFNNEPAYGSTVNYYVNAAEMAKKKALGALVVCVPEAYLPKLMKTLQYPAIDDEDEKAMLDSVGTLCNIVAGRFKSEVSAAGYIELEMSPFNNFRNSPLFGIDFCLQEYDKYEISFDLEGVKRLVVEMTMGVVPLRK